MENKVVKMADEALNAVVGGVSDQLYGVAMDVIDGKYGNGEARVKALKAAGYDYETVQKLVNSILGGGLEAVARDVINGKYGNGEARVKALKAAGYDADKVQALVNQMLK